MQHAEAVGDYHTHTSKYRMQGIQGWSEEQEGELNWLGNARQEGGQGDREQHPADG